MAAPFVRERDSKRHQPLLGSRLGPSHLVDILHLLRKHGYSGVNYYNLGLYLGLYIITLDVIKAKNSGDDRRGLRECLTAWLKQADNVMNIGGPSYDTLIRALRTMGENVVADGIEREISSSDMQPNDSNASIPIDKPEDIQNPLTVQRKIEKWLKEGEVELTVTRINMHGAPGAGKTCSKHLLLNEAPPAPPDKLTDSTPIACRAVQATRISIDDKNKKWKRVNRKDLLNQLASHLKEAPNETKHENFKFAHTLCLIIVFCYTFVKNSRIGTFFVKFVSKLVQLRLYLWANEPIAYPNTPKPTTNKPTDMVLKEISNALERGKPKNLSTNWVYFIDSGGQPAYRELLPLFTRAAALNIITIDLTKGLNDKYEFQYRNGHHTYSTNKKLKYSNHDIIQSTISSEAMLNPVKIPYVSDMPDHPHYLILGTRKELVAEEKLKEMNESLKEYKTNRKVIKHQGSIIYPVNTMLAGPEREKTSVDLCKAVSIRDVTMMIKLPIRLFTLEISLLKEAENRSFLTKKKVIEIGKSLQLDNESDIDDALQYLHNVTIILYYRDVLPNLIFVDPEPILDVLSRLIAVTYVENADSIVDPPPSLDELYNLKELGLFKEDLLKRIGEKIKIFDEGFQSSHMIKLLKHLHIIAKVENREEGDYFFPCALLSCDKLNDPPTEIQPLLIAWEINNRGTDLAIPQGLFPLTIVHLLEQKDKVDFSPDPALDDADLDDPALDNEYYRFYDAMSLRVYKKYTIDIINRYTHIEIRFDGCKDFCPQIRELVTEAIKKSSNDLKVDKNHVFAFKCPKNKQEQSRNEEQKNLRDQCYCIVKEGLCKFSTKCIRCRSPYNIKNDDSYRCWFPPGYCQLLGCGNIWVYMILFAVIIALAGVIAHFMVGKNTEIVSTITTGALPAQHHRGSTTVNPYIDGAVQLSIEDVDMVLTVLDKALFGPTNWNDLGLKLGLIMTQLDVIGESGDSRKSLKGTVKAWLEGADNAKSRTWQTLIDAVRETGNRVAAERIPEKIKS